MFLIAVCLGITATGLSPCSSKYVPRPTQGISDQAIRQIVATREEPAHVPKIALFTIWFGANDACMVPSKQHVPLSRFAANLAYFIEALKSPDSEYYKPHTRVLLFTPPPINTYQRGAELAARDPPQPLDREFDVTRQYADAVKGVGAEKGVPVLDVWTLLYEAAGCDERKLDQFLDDGLHLNAVGYEVRVPHT